MNPLLKKELGKIPAWLTILVVLALAVILVLLILGSKSPETAGPTSPSKKTTEEAQQAKVFSYVGTIKELQPEKIVMAAEAVKNYLEEDAAITVLVTEETRYSKVTVPKTLPEDREPGESLFAREKISGILKSV